MVKLILPNKSYYPSRFVKVDKEGLLDSEKQELFEQKIINTLNQFNSKLKVEQIEYRNLKKEFSHLESESYSGFIIQEVEIKQAETDNYVSNGYIIKKTSESIIIAVKILTYVFLSPMDEAGRNIIVSQSIFPSLMKNINKFLSSSSFSMLNHPIIFINMIDEALPTSIVLHLALIIAAGIHYIEIFDSKTIDAQLVPRKIEPFLDKYDLATVSLDCTNRILYINEPPNNILIKKDGVWQISGSQEKFYWIQILSTTITAVNSGFSIDYEKYENFVKKIQDKIGARSTKASSFEILLEYLTKLSLKKKYHDKI